MWTFTAWICNDTVITDWKRIQFSKMHVTHSNIDSKTEIVYEPLKWKSDLKSD